MSASLQQDLKIPFYANKECEYLGMDSPKHCFDKTHFRQFGSVSYQFNEIGYRGQSVETMHGREILVIGDSFTLGLGVNQSDRWSEQLGNLIGYPVLNFSLNGASNDWIARRTRDLLSWFDPPAIIIHWSFTHRRENARSDWFDDERTECEPKHSAEQNMDNWSKNISSIQHPRIFHSAIPGWHDDFPYQSWPVLPPVVMIDVARDGFHYGPKTHRVLAETFTSLLASG